ncbi:hypothetical protein HYY69_06740 [Candidatus Woesearchaeota archaeon]|nr:hypothetical protein [Candidatus Woesearchaeota archaeon]
MATLQPKENFAKYSQSSGYCQFALRSLFNKAIFSLEPRKLPDKSFENAHEIGSNHNFAKFSKTRSFYTPLFISILLVLIIFLAGCKSQEHKEIPLSSLQDLFKKSLKSECTYTDPDGNKGKVFSDGFHYRIETNNPNLGMLVTIYHDSALYSFSPDQKIGTVLNLSLLPSLDASESLSYFNIKNTDFKCVTASLSDELFLVPQDIVVKDVTGEFKGYVDD